MFKIPMTVFQFFSSKYLSARESIFTSLVRKWKLYSMAFSMQRKRKWEDLKNLFRAERRPEIS